MSDKFGPTRGEHWIRLVISLAGLALLAFALSIHGLRGAAWVEIGLFGGGFLGGSALWSAWKLWKGRA